MLIRFASLEHPDLVHAVTTRAGGVSDAPHTSLNLSFGRPDDPAAVQENRRRVFGALGIDPCRVVQAGQVHGADILIADDRHAGRGALDRSLVLPPADAIVSSTPDLYLFACFADCTPLLFWDPVQRAVGIAHAGWQGTVKRIAAATVEAMATAFGSRPDELRVVVGPSAGPCCYAIGPHVADAAHAAYPGRDDVVLERGQERFFDLWAANLHALADAGVPREHVEVSGMCTIEQHQRFFSHRASGGQTGRFAAVIGVRGDKVTR